MARNAQGADRGRRTVHKRSRSEHTIVTMAGGLGCVEVEGKRELVGRDTRRTQPIVRKDGIARPTADLALLPASRKPPHHARCSSRMSLLYDDVHLQPLERSRRRLLVITHHTRAARSATRTVPKLSPGPGNPATRPGSIPATRQPPGSHPAATRQPGSPTQQDPATRQPGLKL